MSIFFNKNSQKTELKNILNLVLYIKACGNYSYIVTETESHIISKKILDVEKEVPSGQFFRCHQSFIINLTKVKEFDIDLQYFILQGGHFVPLSRRRIKSLPDLKFFFDDSFIK